MDFKKTILPNGLRVITAPIPSLASATVTVWVGCGSRYEEKKVNGISHFLEHMVFKGSKKRPTAKDISQAVDSIGGEFNAATSKDWTNFYIKARVANLDLAFDVLSDMVLRPLLKEEEVEREKGVITEEIRMYEDTPMMKVGDVFENLIFPDSSLGWDITGNSESVKSIVKNDFLRYRKLYYNAENILLTIAGGFKEKEVFKLVDKYFGQVGKGGQKRTSFNENFLQTKPRLSLRTKKNEQCHLVIGFRSEGWNGQSRFPQSVLAAILGGGMSSRLFIEVRERRGLAYSVRTDVERYIDAGYIGTYAGVDVKRAEDAIKVILDEHKKIASGKIEDKELSKSKEFLKGHFALSLEDTRSVSSFLGLEELIKGKIITPEDIFSGIDKVTKDDVVNVANKYFLPDGLNLALIGPYQDGEKFEKIINSFK